MSMPHLGQRQHSLAWGDCTCSQHLLKYSFVYALVVAYLSELSLSVHVYSSTTNITAAQCMQCVGISTKKKQSLLSRHNQNRP